MSESFREALASQKTQKPHAVQVTLWNDGYTCTDEELGKDAGLYETS